MKKKLCVLAVVLGLASQVWARGIGYGPKIGGNFSFISNLNKIPLDVAKNAKATLFDIARTSFHWGAYCEYVLMEKLSIGVEMMYTRAGSIYKSVDMEHALRVSYVNIPVWVMFYPFKVQQGLGIYLGPALNALWHAAPKNLKIIAEKHVGSFDWAIVGGMRYQSFFGLCVDLRYNWSLTDIYNFRGNERPYFMEDVKFRSNVLQLSLAYNLGAFFGNWGIEEAKPAEDIG